MRRKVLALLTLALMLVAMMATAAPASAQGATVITCEEHFGVPVKAAGVFVATPANSTQGDAHGRCFVLPPPAQ